MLFQVIARARRRLLWNALVSQLAIASVVALAVLAMLFLLGTDAVGWWWLITLPAASFAAGMCTVARRFPGTSPTAQLLDRRLNLSDSLSTAVHFAQPAGRCSEEFRRAQSAQAARLAASADLRNAIPVRMPRAMYLAAVLAIAATGLFYVRYGNDAHLDLRQPMAGIVQQLLESTREEIAKLVDEFLPSKSPDREESKQARNRQGDADGDHTDEKPTGVTDSNTVESGRPGQAGQAEEKAKADTFAGEQEASEQGTQSSADARSGSEQNSSSQQAKQGTPQQQESLGAQAASSSASSSSNMMNKIKDSMANLLSALKPQQGGAGGRQPKPQDGSQSGKNGQRGATDSASTSGEAGQGDSTQPGNARPGGSGQGDMAQGEKQKGNGAGRDEGSKQIRSAEQLAAMGKLSTLFGKRAEGLSGEFTVETGPGPQSLRTPYARLNAEHNSAETVAMRDEVPVAYQEYIQHYYDLVRQANATPRHSEALMARTGRRYRAVK